MEKLQDLALLPSFLLFLFLFPFGTKSVDADDGSLSSGTSYFFYQQSEYPRDCNEVLSSCSSTQNISGVYMIKPDGYPEPFEVYCENYLPAGGWTVIQRRQMGLLNFSRLWEDSKSGFGFLGSEFWIGNEKLAFLTNQKKYQLRIDFTNTAGKTCYVTYDRFRISDEWGEYSLLSVGNFDTSTESCVELCPSNTVFSNETCEYSCDDPENCITSTVEERCACIGGNMIHQDNCIPQEQCGCYDIMKMAVIRNGDSYLNADCTRLSQCNNNQLSVDASYRCGAGSTCGEVDGVSACIPEVSTTTDPPLARDCYDLYIPGVSTDGVYTIYPDGYPSGIRVFCGMESNGGGWTFIQRRSSASVDFYRTWNEYKVGFEDPTGDHWLGNDHIHSITEQKSYDLRIDLTDRDNTQYYALYSSFSINDETDKYRLSIGSYSGTAGDRLSWNVNRQFSTPDQDNDGGSLDCAEEHRGGWWFSRGGADTNCHCASGYCDGPCCTSPCVASFCQTSEPGCDWFPLGSSCGICAVGYLNGDYDGVTRGTTIHWSSLRGYDCELTYADMKIRPST